MSIGSGIFLFVVGAILRFALNIEVAWIDLMLVGNIMMIAGAVVFVLGLVFMFRRRQSTSTRRTVVGQPDGQALVERTENTRDTDL
ncbi:MULTISPECIES: DUF6458 family protein [Arthrobacter]|uniref:DUF6458 family protein n=1 Tax=unclassified Arthrobacter TaxID=235627 RepID=UPI0024B974B7|nr:DUF6458 family protein [Arthrobacter sp. H35-MC1]MDJ0316104.1 DUF6458 family protein [Arthrobacter sp. H35-MC1]